MKIIYIFISISFLYYLSLPNIDYPPKLEPSIQSFEPADVESFDRRGYYTDEERDYVMDFYSKNYKLNLIGIRSIRLNYPPEDAQILIRDQARSTFLEEIVYPFRESLFVNGFKPEKDKDAILIDDKRWVEKIIAKRVISTPPERLFVGLLTIVIVAFVYNSYLRDFNDVSLVVKNLRNGK